MGVEDRPPPQSIEQQTGNRRPQAHSETSDRAEKGEHTQSCRSFEIRGQKRDPAREHRRRADAGKSPPDVRVSALGAIPEISDATL